MPSTLGITASDIPFPAITLNTASNFNQSIATLNATVSAYGSSTTISFEYATNTSFTGSTTVTGYVVSGGASSTTGDGVSVYANISGLTENTTYYFRATATNGGGTQTTASSNYLSFTTWHLIEWAMGTAGTYYLTLPTVTPTNGTQVIPGIKNVFILGGGGGHAGWGGCGGGYRLVSSRDFSSTANLQLTLIVGGGGASAGGSGGTSQITASNFTSIDAGGGASGDGGHVGYGDNANYVAGASASWTAGGKGDPIYLGYGGGAGISGNGGNAVAGNAYAYGGAGGAGGSAYGYNGGAGGSGYGNNGDYGSGAYYGYGSGGYNNGNVNGTAGSAGLVRFQYYGA